MRLVYVDDSEQSRPRRRELGPLLALGAVIVPGDQVAGYAADLAAIRTDLGVPAEEEIKWKPPKNSFLADAGGELVSTLRCRMLEAAIERQIHTAVVIIDHDKAYTSRSKAEVGREILRWLYDRISMHLRDHDDIGVVIADKPGGGSAEESRWLAETLELTSLGTEYVKPDRVVMPIVTAPSHHVPHLQLADLVTAATTAAVAGYPHGLALDPLLLRLAHKNRYGFAGGAGIVLWPTLELANLLFWAFGETTYAKVKMNTVGPCLGGSGPTPRTTASPEGLPTHEVIALQPADGGQASYPAAADRYLAVSRMPSPVAQGEPVARGEASYGDRCRIEVLRWPWSHDRGVP